VRRIVGNFLENTFLVNTGGLSAATDQRKDRVYQHVMRAGNGVWNLAHDDVPNASTENLLHDRSVYNSAVSFGVAVLM
jgi:hypothetical protein